jgi:transketolase
VACGWNVTRVGDANDLEMLDRAFRTFKNTHDRPTIIIADSHIAYGSPNKQDTSAAHGAPLGVEEIRLTKRTYGWPEESHFLVPDGVHEHFAQGIGRRGQGLRETWMLKFQEYKNEYADLADQLYKMQHRQLPIGWDKTLPQYPPDLAPSTKTRLTFDSAGDFTPISYGGRNFHFGVREHAMASILNGMSHCKVRPYGSGFLIFSDYSRPAIRLSALMELPVIYVFTHDSIGVGEDGPTHQPVEQLASLRAVPGLVTLRPADANEVVEAWRVVLQMQHQPVALVLSRQNMPTVDRAKYGSASGVAKGAYVLADADDGQPEVLLLATGSEVSLCLDAYEQLNQEGIGARVVSMPSCELFDQQSEPYRQSVLPPEVTARVSVEQASTLGWARYVGADGHSIGMRTFGASAPLKELQRKFGFTPENVVFAAKQQLEKARQRDHQREEALV